MRPIYRSSSGSLTSDSCSAFIPEMLYVISYHIWPYQNGTQLCMIYDNGNYLPRVCLFQPKLSLMHCLINMCMSTSLIYSAENHVLIILYLWCDPKWPLPLYALNITCTMGAFAIVSDSMYICCTFFGFAVRHPVSLCTLYMTTFKHKACISGRNKQFHPTLFCGMQLLILAWATCFWHQSHHISQWVAFKRWCCDIMRLRYVKRTYPKISNISCTKF